VLSVGDNLKRTIDHVLAKAQDAEAQDSALKSFLEGVELTERELLKVLERHDVSRSEPLGEHFDPNCHQAMYEVHDSNVADGTVVDVMQAGYVIGDRCLRPALVAVAKGRAKANVPEQGEEGSQSPPMTTAPTVDTRDKPE
jgi:molecular chaperone GrpE